MFHAVREVVLTFYLCQIVIWQPESLTWKLFTKSLAGSQLNISVCVLRLTVQTSIYKVQGRCIIFFHSSSDDNAKKILKPNHLNLVRVCFYMLMIGCIKLIFQSHLSLLQITSRVHYVGAIFCLAKKI